MKTRILAVLLALAVVLALALPALAAVPADTVPYNTGTRHETCTALSTQAEQYYTDGAETLLKLSGSTSDSSLESMDSALYRALQSLMTDTMTDSVTYKSLPTYWARTDASQGKDGLLLFYSDTTGGRMSREHVWPKSRGKLHAAEWRQRPAPPAPRGFRRELHAQQLYHGQRAGCLSRLHHEGL